VLAVLAIFPALTAALPALSAAPTPAPTPDNIAASPTADNANSPAPFQEGLLINRFPI
jgi:hypothetical protein